MSDVFSGAKPTAMQKVVVPRLNVFRDADLNEAVGRANDFMAEMQSRLRWESGSAGVQQLNDGEFLVVLAWEELVEVRFVDMETRAVLERATPEDLILGKLGEQKKEAA